MLRIGSVQLETPLLLAPIAGYCDLAFRLVVRRLRGPTGLGVGLACTDLLCPQAILSENQKSLWLAATCPEDKPVCMQLYGADPAILAEAARWAQAHGATTIDINMGCPVDKVTKKNGGSKLLCDPGSTVLLAKQVVEAVTVPVTAKLRLGWDDQHIVAPDLAPALADVGIAAITIHGRTTEQMFRPSARLEGIARVVESMRRHPLVPVIGNGDVKSPQDAKRMMDVTGCAGVMIGRGALAQPWIFRDTAHYLATGELPEPLSRAEKARVVLGHFESLLHYRGERIAVNMINQRISWYSPHLQPWPGLRQSVRTIRSAAEFRDFMGHGIARLEEFDAGGGTSEPEQAEAGTSAPEAA
ncbi:MAG: tRNA dihydrouridine synthase DusB [Planctomycetota bacterium]|nr:tRNA dihydrouridine synthase DusB [Planctomycetota bacterium]